MAAIQNIEQATEQDVLRSISFTAAALDIHYKTVARWARKGFIKSVTLGAARRIPDSEIRRIQQEGIRAEG